MTSSRLSLLTVFFLTLGATGLSPTPVDAAEEPGTAASAETVAVVGAKVADGQIYLWGDIEDDTIIVAMGDTLVVELEDTDTHYMHAVVVPTDGSAGEAWERNEAEGLSTHTFPGVVEDVQCIVYAVAKETGKSGSANKIKYGPVITVKPKG